VDSAGDTIDFMLSPKRDLTAARLFLRLALTGTSSIRPRVINVDGHPAYTRAIAELKQSAIWVALSLPAITLFEQHY
jgi:transposase-like protein